MRSLNNLKLHRLFLLSIFVLLLPTFSFCPSHAQGEDDDNTIRTWKEKRSQFQGSNSTFALAANRARRIDPSNHFKYYEDGWDVANSHYYLSLVFSAAPVLAIAAVWFFGVVLFFIIALFCLCCCNNNKPEVAYSPKLSWISLIFLALFFVMAVGGAVLLYGGQEKFQKAINVVMDLIVRRIIAVVDLLQTVMDNFDGATKMTLGAYSLPDEYKKKIEQVQTLITRTSRIPKNEAKKVVDTANKFLEVVSYCLKVVTAVILGLAVLGFITSVCGCKVVVYFLLFIGWILVTATFILCSVSLVVQNGVGDTCVAMADWLEHPENRTVLTKLLPCVDEATARRAQDVTKSTSFQIVNLVNSFVKNVANTDKPQDGKIGVFYNQSGPYLPLLCSPFNQDMTDRACDPLEIRLDNAPQAYQSFVCNTSSRVCNSMGRLTPDLYYQMIVATNMSHTLYRDGPFLIDLADCTFVAQTFDEISDDHHCPAMRRYTSQVFIGLMLVSLALMLSVILWVVNVRERHHQKSSKNFRKTHVVV